MKKVIEIKEVTTRYITKKTGAKVSNPEAIQEIFSYLQDETKEKFIAVHLNTQLNIISYEVVSIGSLDVCAVTPREVFKTSLLLNASSVILVHNHPSGNACPSKEDISLTENLVAAGKILGIKVLDHIIIGDAGKFHSLKEDNLL